MWIRKPTPVTTESMVSDRPSNTEVEADVEITDRHPGPQRHADRLFAVSEKVDANVRGDQRRQPTEPMPTVAERFSDQRPREKASSTKPINGKRMVKASMFIHATHLLNRCSGSGGDDGAAAAAPGRYSLPQPRG